MSVIRHAARAARYRRSSVGSSSADADEQAPGDGVRLARERTPTGLLERRSRLGTEIGRHAPFELRRELGGLVEVVGPDLDELVARPDAPASHCAIWRWSSARDDFESPAYATSRIKTCLKR